MPMRSWTSTEPCAVISTQLLQRRKRRLGSGSQQSSFGQALHLQPGTLPLGVLLRRTCASQAVGEYHTILCSYHEQNDCCRPQLVFMQDGATISLWHLAAQVQPCLRLTYRLPTPWRRNWQFESNGANGEHTQCILMTCYRSTCPSEALHHLSIQHGPGTGRQPRLWARPWAGQELLLPRCALLLCNCIENRQSIWRPGVRLRRPLSSSRDVCTSAGNQRISNKKHHCEDRADIRRTAVQLSGRGGCGKCIHNHKPCPLHMHASGQPADICRVWARLHDCGCALQRLHNALDGRQEG